MKRNPRKDTELLNAVAGKLRQLRKACGVSQKNVFIDTDIHVGRIELGKQNITLSTLAILCDYYKISLEDFFTALLEIPKICGSNFNSTF